MNKSIIQVLGSLEELNFSQISEDYSKIRTFRIDSTNYGLLLYSTNEKGISFFNLHLSKLICEGSYNIKSLTDNYGKEPYELTLLKVFHLSFNVIDVVCTTENIWTIGYKAVLDLRPYLKSALEKFQLKNECMDADYVEEYNPEKLVVSIDVLESNNLFDQEDAFIGCSFIDDGFVLCRKNSTLGRWQLELVQLGKRNSLSSNGSSEQFLNFPVSFDDNTRTCSFGDRKEVCVPVIRFVHSSSPERVICENLLGIRCLPSSIICLVGHPDGKLLWSSWDKNHLHSSEDLQTLLDTKQPIIAMDFFEESKDGGCLLIVGSLGQMTVISPSKHSSQSFRIETWHLKSSVVDCVVVKKCLVYFSKSGTLGMAELSELMASKKLNKVTCVASSCTELASIQQMTSVGKDEGLILMLSNCGNLYLTLCVKEECSSSLPFLMNECVTQCTSMQELLRTKSLQSRLFATISTFASLKCSANLSSHPISFSISEVSLQPRKYLLVIDCRCLKKYRLDPELCHLSASVCTTAGCILLSKTVAYQPEDPSVCLEMCESILLEDALCPSPFPLFVEVGLLLHLPLSFTASMDCSALSHLLPLQLCLCTLMIHDSLHLSAAHSLKPLPCRARQLAEDRPVANVLLPRSHTPASPLPEKFDLCLSLSTVQQMMTIQDNTRGVDPCAFISRLLFGTREGPALISVKKDNVVVSGCGGPDALIALRGAVLHTLLSHEVTCDPSTHVMIPASLYRKAEDICGRLLSVFGRDLESEEVTQTLLTLYRELRREVSDKMPIL